MSQTERHVTRVTINAPPETVWAELTRTDAPQKAIFNMKMHTDGLKPGGQIRMRTPDGKYTGVVGEILEWDPPHRFSHTFSFTNFDDPPCTVIYELKDVGGKTEFTLISENVPAGTKTAKQMKSGGKMIANNLKSIIERGKLPLGTRLLYGLFKLMGPLTPKRTRSENFPL